MPSSQNRKFIEQNVQYFFQNVMDSWQCVDLNSNSAPIIHYLAPFLFMQLCGFVEQKCNCILWEIGYHNYYERYGLMREHSIESIDHKKFKNLFTHIKDPVKNMQMKLLKKNKSLKSKILSRSS